MSSIKKLGEVFDIRKGKKAAAVADTQIAGSFPYIQIDEVRGAKPSKFAIDHRPVLATEDDICIVWDGANAGTVGYGVNGAVGSTVARMRLRNRSDWEPRFLGRLLEGKFPQLNREAQGRGATIPHVDKARLEAIEFPDIPPSEQRRIAKILDKADAIRRKREGALCLAEDFLKSLFLDMFGDPTTNRKRLNKTPLGEIIRVSSGDGLIAKNMAHDGIYPVYGGNGINGYHSHFMFEDPQIVIGRVGVYCGAVHITKPRSWITDNALYVREYKKRINKTYLEWALRFANLNQYAGRAAQPLISGGRIYEVEILEPEIGEQDTFEKLVAEHRSLQTKLSLDSDLSDQLFSALSQRAFRGEL